MNFFRDAGAHSIQQVDFLSIGWSLDWSSLDDFLVISQWVLKEEDETNPPVSWSDDKFGERNVFKKQNVTHYWLVQGLIEKQIWGVLEQEDLTQCPFSKPDVKSFEETGCNATAGLRDGQLVGFKKQM